MPNCSKGKKAKGFAYPSTQEKGVDCRKACAAQEQAKRAAMSDHYEKTKLEVPLPSFPGIPAFSHPRHSPFSSRIPPSSFRHASSYFYLPASIIRSTNSQQHLLHAHHPAACACV